MSKAVKSSQCPLNYSANKKKFLFAALNEAIATFLTQDKHCCFPLFSRKKPYDDKVNEMRLMQNCGLENDILLNARYFFQKDLPYVFYVKNSVEELFTSNDFMLLEEFFFNTGLDYLEEDKCHELAWEKLEKILRQFKIFFVVDRGSSTTIITLPLQRVNTSSFTLKNLSAVISIILQNTFNIVYCNADETVINIKNTNRRDLSLLQKKILNISKKMMREYLEQNQITVVNDIKNKNSILFQSDEKYSATKLLIENDFKHYPLKMEECDYHLYGRGYFKIKNPDFIDFIAGLSETFTEIPDLIDKIDIVSEAIKLYQDDNYYVTELITPEDDKTSETYRLRLSMRSEKFNYTCEKNIKNLLNEYFLGLEIDSKSSPIANFHNDFEYNSVKVLGNKPVKLEDDTLYVINKVDQTDETVYIVAKNLETPIMLNSHQIELLDSLFPSLITIPFTVTKEDLIVDIMTICGLKPAIEFISTEKAVLQLLRANLQGLSANFMTLINKYEIKEFSDGEKILLDINAEKVSDALAEISQLLTKSFKVASFNPYYYQRFSLWEDEKYSKTQRLSIRGISQKDTQLLKTFCLYHSIAGRLYEIVPLPFPVTKVIADYYGDYSTIRAI